MRVGGDTFLTSTGYITAALLIGMLAMVGNVSGANNVSVCGPISASGEYVLNTSLSQAATCITITSSDVVFDGGGYTIDGTGSGYGVYVYNSSVTLTNVTVKNLKVTDWQYGIYLHSYKNNANSDNVASNNY